MARAKFDRDATLQEGYRLYGEGNVDGALACVEKILDKNPRDAAAYYLAGICHMAANDNETALVMLRRAAERAPDQPAIWETLASAWQYRGEWDGALAGFRRAFELAPAPWRHSNLIWAVAHHPRMEASALTHEQFEYGKRWGGGHLWDTVDRDWSPYRKLRVGYVSADFRYHSAQDIIGPIFFNHDRDHYELYTYYGGTPEQTDPYTLIYREKSDGWCETYQMTDEQLAQKILDDRIDVLVDLAGHSGGNRLGVFGMKPAPVQCSGWGFAIGTGLREIDGYMTDRITAPERWAQGFLPDRPAYLPCVVTFNPHRQMPDVTPAPLETNGYLTFGYLGRIGKASREVLDVWSRLLRMVPESRLYIKEMTLADGSCRDRVMDTFVANSIDPARITIEIEPVERVAHVGCYSNVDVALDPFPIAGGITTLEAAWQGVPTLSWPGEHMASRNAASIMHHVGLRGWAVPREVDGWALMNGLVKRPHELISIRANLREKLANSPICQTEAYCRAVEDVYRSLWIERIEERRADAA